MKKIRCIAYVAGITLALIVGYVAGMIKGARVERFYSKCIQMSYDSAIAKLMEDGKYDEARKSASHMAFLNYRDVAGSPLLHTWVLPFVDVDGGDLLAWRVNDGARHMIESTGAFVKEYERQSNKPTEPTAIR